MPYFISYTGRCGSTVVSELLARHSNVVFVSNVDDKLSRLDPVRPVEQRPVPQGGTRLRQFLAAHRSKLRITNPLERVNREIGRRTDVVCDTSLRDPTNGTVGQHAPTTPLLA